ncbi:MAG TPA: tyrosine-type recombinase/integrase [Acidimicrobiales bacterium]|nr:tyrosine-type recombinase/integrase [Acidimicrobiales bacterium]
MMPDKPKDVQLKLPRLIDIPTLATALGVSDRHIRRLVFDGRIPYVKWDHLVRFDEDEVTEWLQGCRRGQSAAATGTAGRQHLRGVVGPPSGHPGSVPQPWAAGALTSDCDKRGRSMTRRRDFGSVRQLSSVRWQARYILPAGERVTAPRTFATKAEAGRWLAATDTDRSRGLWVDPRAGKIRLDEYARAWLDSQARIAPRTREIYESQIEHHILPVVAAGVPALGDALIADMTSELVRAWYAALARDRSASIAAKAYTRLRQILSQAVDDDRIAKNPCRIDGGGAERHPEQRFASLSELYDLANAVPAGYRALILTAGLAGLRQGELFGLRRRDVDLLQARITVRRKRLRLSSGQVIEDEPKSEAGRRTVAIPAQLVAELEAHLATLAQPGVNGYVFTSPAGVPLERSNFRYRVWVPAARAVGLEGLRFHDLHHTAGTLAARTGATTKEPMARLGHSSPQAAMVYQHAAEDRDRLIAERLDAMASESGLAPVLLIAGRHRGTGATETSAG